ncbi:HNH endonuclease [Paenibacillus sp. VCA1]|uniref:HNH endonuclease n=1 Tax=Paenibacillus sp. VCA1 TaxID=3039148 RepID=UPI0028725404|nr:HNH endonuclease [Paenibacillus sp. VCA1]MDR9852850.1 HNH endonuclease [Paenibacillus sp. VCA1]
MIKIKRITCPNELTEDVKKNLTQEYKISGKNVWNLEYIKNALLEMSKGKCIFCECKLGEESKFVEVEHFHPKSIYPDEVVEWTNLLPICKRCNGKKLDHDTKKYPIINPTINDPKTHLKMKNYRFIGKDQIGKETIGVLSLNDLKRLVYPRSIIGNKIAELLEDLLERIDDLSHKEELSRREINSITHKLENLLNSCQSDSEYSATCAYSLFGDENYYEIRCFFVEKGLWDTEFELLETSAKNNWLEVEFVNT